MCGFNVFSLTIDLCKLKQSKRYCFNNGALASSLRILVGNDCMMITERTRNPCRHHLQINLSWCLKPYRSGRFVIAFTP